MNPALAALILEFSLKYGIPAARQIVQLLQKPTPSLEDWNKVFDAAEVNARAFLADTAPK